MSKNAILKLEVEKITWHACTCSETITDNGYSNFNLDCTGGQPSLFLMACSLPTLHASG